MVLALVMCVGCISGETLFGDNAEKVVDASATGLSLLGPWGVAGGGLLTTIYAAGKSYFNHGDAKKSAMNLGKDTYAKYQSMSKEDKHALDKDVRAMVPAKYQKYYDLGKSFI